MSGITLEPYAKPFALKYSGSGTKKMSEERDDYIVEARQITDDEIEKTLKLLFPELFGKDKARIIIKTVDYVDVLKSLTKTQCKAKKRAKILEQLFPDRKGHYFFITINNYSVMFSHNHIEKYSVARKSETDKFNYNRALSICASRLVRKLNE